MIYYSKTMKKIHFIKLNLIKKISIFLGIIFLLTSCRLEIDGELYVADVIDVGEGNGILNTPMNLSFEMSSKDKCNEDKEEISNILKNYFINFVAKDCYSEDFNSFLRIGADIPIIIDPVPGDGKVDVSDQSVVSFAVVKGENEQSNYYSSYLALNNQLFELISKDIKSKYYQTLKLDKTKIKLAINNDGRETEEIRFASSFVNGKPVVFPQNFKIERRQKIDYHGSDVTTAAFNQDKLAYIFTIIKAK